MRKISKWAASLTMAALTLALTLGSLFTTRSAQAQSTSTAPTVTLFGALSNFDVLNDTGQEAYGFEIELDGISATNFYTFNFNRFGAPTIVPFARGVYVRYMSAYDPVAQQFTVGTPVATNFTPTTGHQCISAFPAYQSSGCDHFGVSLANNPSNTVYRWLVADPQNPGSLIPFNTPVSIPAPVWTVAPPAQGAVAPVVVAEIEAPKPPAGLQFGQAQWVKVFKTELPREVGLDELVTDNPVVPEDAAAAETPWKLLQVNPHSPKSGALINQGGVNSGSRSVVRRYEFYKYTGALDPLTGEALCGGDGTCTAPLDGELGDYIGAQMAAANVGVPSITVAKVGSGTVTGAGGKINCGGSCTTAVALGTVVTLTANPGGNAFTGWTGDCTGTQLTCTLTVNDAMNVAATFTPQFTLSIGRGGSGTVVSAQPGINCGGACSAKFVQGTTVGLTATPAAGLRFINWTGACSGTAPTCNVTITQNTQVQANFAK